MNLAIKQTIDDLYGRDSYSERGPSIVPDYRDSIIQSLTREVARLKAVAEQLRQDVTFLRSKDE